jgi:hypothetical protein
MLASVSLRGVADSGLRLESSPYVTAETRHGNSHQSIGP